MHTLSVRISSLCACSACFEGPFQIWNFYAYAEHTHKKLMRMLRLCISSWPVCSVYASVPDLYAHWCRCSSCFEGTALFKIRLSPRVRNFVAPNKGALLQDVPQNSATQHGWCRLILLGRGKRLLYMGREFAPSGTEVFRNHRKFPAIFTMKKGRMRMVGSNSVPLDY